MLTEKNPEICFNIFRALHLCRYLYVFHETWLNYIDESSIKRSTRIFVGILSLISVLTGDRENTHLYLLLTDSPLVDMKNDSLIRSKPLFFVILILFTTSIVIHYRIEIFKKQVDSQSEAGENYQEGNCEYSMNTGRIIICIGSILILIMVFYLCTIETDMENFFIRRHESLALMQFFNMNVIPMILIVRNENMLHFFKNEIKSFSVYIIMCPLFVMHVLCCNKL